jgi:hypothetical protein
MVFENLFRDFYALFKSNIVCIGPSFEGISQKSLSLFLITATLL